MVDLQFVFFTLLKIFAIIIPITLCVAFATLAERKIIGFMQLRNGPNRVSFFGIDLLKGLAQPFADVFKAYFKRNNCSKKI